MRKNSSKYLLFLLCVAFTPSALNGVWWKVAPKKQEGRATDYASSFGGHLRANTTLFRSVPMAGKIKWYHILGVSKDATPEEIRQARMRLVRAVHTDKDANCDVELSKAVNAAMEESRLSKEHFLAWSGTYHSKHNPRFNFRGTGSEYDTVPAIDSIADLFHHGGESNKAEQVNVAKFPEEFRNLTTQWKRFYIAKFAIIGGALLVYKFLEKQSKTKEGSLLVQNRTVRQCIAWRNHFKKKHPNWSAFIERGGFVTLAALYPLYRFRKVFTLASLTGRYPFETRHFNEINQDDIKVFYRMFHTYTRIIHTSNGTKHVPVYEPTFPICYMPADQERKEFMPIRKSQVMSAIMVATSIAATWLGCAW